MEVASDSGKEGESRRGERTVEGGRPEARGGTGCSLFSFPPTGAISSLKGSSSSVGATGGKHAGEEFPLNSSSLDGGGAIAR